jgi:hypothetical protein
MNYQFLKQIFENRIEKYSHIYKIYDNFLLLHSMKFCISLSDSLYEIKVVSYTVWSRFSLLLSTKLIVDALIFCINVLQ